MLFQVALFVSCVLHVRGSGTCPGEINVAGYGPVSIVNAKWNLPGEPAGRVDVPDSRGVIPHMTGRSYWAKSCTNNKYDHKDYVALNLLGKTFRYTTDMSGAGCGCNAALYLTSLHQNSAVSGCSDYYCDANNVCGQSCAEIDIQEANQVAWHSTLHTQTDHSGVGGGYGGGSGWNGPRNWNPSQYGHGASCIDTNAAFDVAISFPVDGQGTLQAMQVTLSQKGKSCPLQLNLNSYGGMGELSAALAAGMTPIISYWSSPDMGWMDGKGSDGQGPCDNENPGACSQSVKFYDFSIAKIGEDPPKPQAVIGNDKEKDQSESNTGSSDHVHGGICCFAAEDGYSPSDKESFCRHCEEQAIAPRDSICSRSQETCEICGGTSTWCSANMVKTFVRK